MTQNPIPEEDDVLLILPSAPAAEGANLAIESALRPHARGVSAEKLKQSWDKLMAELNHILEETLSKTVGGFRLDEVAIGLGVEASGGIGIVSAGAEATITATFKRADAS